MPNTLHHVMVRGIEQAAIVLGNADRADFLVRLGRRASLGTFAVWTWALLQEKRKTT